MGSLTIFGTVELQVLLRTFDVLGIGLVLLWALSPLGGQASLRLLESGTQSTSSNQSIPYLNPEAESILVYGGDTVQEIGFYINALYIAALFTAPAIQASPVDTWSNVKVPIIEKLESTSKSDADGWYAVSPENASYSSLVGLPVDATLLRSTPSLLTSSNPNGTRRMGSYFFSVESIYMTLDCPTVSDFTLVNGTTHGGFFIQFENSTQLILYPNQTSYPTVEPWRVDFSALSNIASDNAFTANCTLTRSSVESNVTCDGGSCSVTQIRRSLFDQRPPGWTPLNYGVSMGSMEDNWPLSGGNKISGRSTPTEYFISDPTMDSLSRARFSGGISLKGVSAEDFSERLSLVFNTYWQCSNVPWYLTENITNNASALNDDPSAAGEAPFNTTTTLVTTLTEIYVCNGTWAVILLAASTALLLCGLCGAIVKHKTRGPKILGYVSTITRDNPYIDLPSEGCTLDGLERAKLLKGLKVKLQDVAPDDAVGHIAFGSAEAFGTGKLKVGRLYV